MPTYEFRCPKGHDFEKFYRSISAAPTEVHCPDCGALAVRQMSGAGLVFKGSGFYITDYGKDGKKDQQKAPVKSDSGTPEKSDSGSEKPADAAAKVPSETKAAAGSDSKASGGASEPKPAPAPAPVKKKEPK